MTCLQKAKELRPGLSKNEIIDECCPGHILGRKYPTCMNCNAQTDEDCTIHWNEEYKE